MTYDFNQHKHNFAVWTAARAVQRGFATTPVIKKAIENSDLRKYSEEKGLSVDQNAFDSFHKKCAAQIIMGFNQIGKKDVKYGRAAKIISIYLKTSVILPDNGRSKRSKVIHPPIDNILLTNICDFNKSLKLKTNRWTQLDEKEYWDLVKLLREKFKRFDWTLEEFWYDDDR